MRPTPSQAAPVVLLTAVALTGATDVASAATKRRADVAAPVINSITVNPSPVVLGTKKNGTTSFKVTLKASDNGGVDRVTVGLYDPSDSSGKAFRLKRTGGSATDGVWTGTLVLQNAAKTGAWSVRAFASDLASNTSNPDTVYGTFRVTLPTLLDTFVAKADSTTGALTATALLRRLKPGKGWVAFGDREVVLEFMPSGANAYLAVAKAKSAADGTVRFDKVTTNQSGSWRVNYLGATGYAPDVSGARSITVAGSSSIAPGTVTTQSTTAQPTVTEEPSEARATPEPTPAG